MKKILLIFGLLLVLSSLAVAGWGTKEGTEGSCSWGDKSAVKMIGWSLVKLLYLVVASFVFSVVFWLTGKRIMRGCCKNHPGMEGSGKKRKRRR
ncbi:hypothetical protein ACFL0W_06260 [Nanoarchaeota archaeon]